MTQSEGPSKATLRDGRRQFMPPRVPMTAFPRPRLISRLASWGDTTVVHGPLGSGKTTLLASWITLSELRAFWCEPDEGRLPFAEFDHFVEAGGGVLVIDRAERIGSGELARLGRLIDRTPQLRLVVATRSKHTIPDLAASSDAALDVIGPEDMLVTLEDIRHSSLLTDDDARLELLRQCDGLMIAVRARLDEIRSGVSNLRQRLRHRLQAEFGDATEKFEIVLRLALLPRVDRSILSAWHVSEQVVSELEMEGIVEWSDEWLSLQSFIGSILAEDAQQMLSVDERRKLIGLAVRSSLIGKDPLLALRVAFEVDDLVLATEVALANMVELLEQRDETYAIFRAVRTSSLRGFPALIVLFVLLSNMEPDTRPRALQLLATESLFQRVQSNRGSHRERVLYRAFEAAALRLTPFSGRALPLIRRSIQDFLALGEADVEALGRMGPMLLVHLGIGAFYAGDPDVAKQCFELSDAMHLEAGRPDRVDPLSMRGGLAALSGDIPLARRLLAEADEAEWPRGWRGSSPADFFNLGMALLAIEDGDPQTARSYLDAAGPIQDIIEHWHLFALAQARADRLAGNVEAGLVRLRLLREQRSAAPGTPVAMSFLDAAEGELLLSSGQPEMARSVILRSAKHSPDARLILARAKLALERFSAAAMHAQRALNSPTTTLRSRLEAELVLACVSLRTGQHGDAELVASRIAELIRVTGMRAPLRTIANPDRGPLGDLLSSAGIDPSIIAQIGAEKSPYGEGSSPPVMLTSRERAVLQAFAESQTVVEVAERLFVSRNTVKSHLKTIYRKLHVSSRRDALTRAAILGLIEETDQ